jgi:hypothetical protein
METTFFEQKKHAGIIHKSPGQERQGDSGGDVKGLGWDRLLAEVFYCEVTSISLMQMELLVASDC